MFHMGIDTPLSGQAGICLMCACENADNRLGRFLLGRTEALSATGVVAAVFIAGSAERDELLFLARGAIAEQRERCMREGLFKQERCPEIVKAKTA